MLSGSPAEQPPKFVVGSLVKQVSTPGGGSRKYSWLKSFFRPLAATNCSSSVWIWGSVRHACTTPLTNAFPPPTGHSVVGYGSVSTSAPPKVVWYCENAPV